VSAAEDVMTSASETKAKQAVKRHLVFILLIKISFGAGVNGNRQFWLNQTRAGFPSATLIPTSLRVGNHTPVRRFISERGTSAKEQKQKSAITNNSI